MSKKSFSGKGTKKSAPRTPQNAVSNIALIFMTFSVHLQHLVSFKCVSLYT